MSIRPAFLLALSVVVAGACSQESTTAPNSDLSAASAAEASPGTTTDTTSAPYTGETRVFGRVLEVSYRTPAPGSADSLQVAPVGGAVVKLYRNVLVNGAGTSVFVAELTTGADGSYQFRGIPGGYYLLRTNVATGPLAGNYLDYLAANAAEVALDIRLWQRSTPAPVPGPSTPPPDSTTSP